MCATAEFHQQLEITLLRGRQLEEAPNRIRSSLLFLQTDLG